MPLLKRKRVLAAKVETNVGTAETLTATEAGFNAYDVTIQPSIEVSQREAEGSFNYLTGTPSGRMGTCTFKTPVYIGASLPAWASTFLPACGWVDSSNVFTPRSEALGSNVKSVTIGVYEDGKVKKIAGAVGTLKIVCPTGKEAYIDWSFQGVWQAVADATLLSQTDATDLPVRFASATCTYDSVAQKVESVTVDAGNTIVMREDPTTAAGYISGIVTSRYPKITANPESTLVGTDDHYGDWLAATEAAFAVTLNGPSSSSLAIAAPKAQIVNSQEGDRNGLQTDDIEWVCNKNGATADQELSLTFTMEV